MRTFLGRLLLFLLPLAAGEAALRLHPGTPTWYAAEAEEVRSLPAATAEVVFVGSSRVAAAVDAPGFAERCGEALGRPMHGVNAGRGSSTAAMHALGLRAMWSAGDLRGAVVLIEAAGGVAGITPGWSDAWGETWAGSGYAAMIVPYLRLRDLPELLGSAAPREEKLMLALLSTCHLCEYFWVRRGNALKRAELGVDRLLAPSTTEPSELSAAGGVRNDAAGIEALRRTAEQLARDDMRRQTPVGDWEGTAVAHLVRWVEDHGGQARFFVMPLSPVQQPMLETTVRQRDRDAFVLAAKRWGSPVVDVPFETTGDDFPDNWHMRHSRAAAYTAALVSALCTKERWPGGSGR